MIGRNLPVITSNSPRVATARASLPTGSVLQLIAEHTIDIVESAYAAWIRANYDSRGYENPFGHELEQAGTLSQIVSRAHKILRQCDLRFHEESSIPQIADTLLNALEVTTDLEEFEAPYRNLIKAHAAESGLAQRHYSSSAIAIFHHSELEVEL